MSEITKHRGDTKPIVFQLWEDKEAGLKLDITSFTFKLTVNAKKAPVEGTDDPEFTLVGDIVGSPLDGRVRFLPSAEQMNLEIKTWYYDLEVTDSEGFSSTEKLDKFKIIQDITK